MTSADSIYPHRRLGEVAEVHGFTDDGPWIAAGAAYGITGINTWVLARWEREGVISVLRTSRSASRLYLKPEMEVLATLTAHGPPDLRRVRCYVKMRIEDGGHHALPVAKRAAGRPVADGKGGEQAEEFPVISFGLVAKVNRARSGPWMTGHFASLLTGVPLSRLNRWCKAGLLSYRQDGPGEPTRYLRAELVIVSELGEGEPPTVHTVRRHVRLATGMLT